MSFPFHIFSESHKKDSKIFFRKATRETSTKFNYGEENTELMKKILDEGFYSNNLCVRFLFDNSRKFNRLNLHMVIIVYNLMYYCFNKYGNDNLDTIYNEFINKSLTGYFDYLNNETNEIPDNVLNARIKIEFNIYRNILLNIINET